MARHPFMRNQSCRFTPLNSLTSSSQRLHQIIITARSGVNYQSHFQQNHKIQTCNVCKSCGAQHSRLRCRFRHSKRFKCGKLGNVYSVRQSSRASVANSSIPGGTCSFEFRSLSLVIVTSTPSRNQTGNLSILLCNVNLSLALVDSFVSSSLVRHIIPSGCFENVDVSTKGISFCLWTCVLSPTQVLTLTNALFSSLTLGFSSLILTASNLVTILDHFALTGTIPNFESQSLVSLERWVSSGCDRSLWGIRGPQSL